MIKDSDYYKLKASDCMNQILIETISTILYEKGIISGDIEFDQYLDKVLKKNDNELLNELNTSIFTKNFFVIVEKEDQLNEEDEKYLRENLMQYCDINTEEQVENYIKTIKEKKQLNISMKKMFGGVFDNFGGEFDKK